MTEYGKVSIIMPSYNTAAYIGPSIKSVLMQTYNDWELIIVDDCSTDNTRDVLNLFHDSRIKLLLNQENMGAALSRNRALREATGRWIAFLDSDDLWEPAKLERQLSYMNENGYAFTYTDYRVELNGKWNDFVTIGPDKVNLRKLYNWCYFSTITVIYDSSVVGLIQISDLKKHNDYAMWFQALKKTDAVRFPECLSYYIKHENSVSSGSKIRLIKHHYVLFRKELNKKPIIALFLTVNNILHGLMRKLRYKYQVDTTPDNVETIRSNYASDSLRQHNIA